MICNIGYKIKKGIGYFGNRFLFCTFATIQVQILHLYYYLRATNVTTLLVKVLIPHSLGISYCCS